MRLLTLIVTFLIILIQYPLWFGKGGWLHVRELNHQLAEQQQQNQILRERNRRLEKNVQDLKEGMDAIEEQARFDLGMIRQGEYFVKFIQPKNENQ